MKSCSFSSGLVERIETTLKEMIQEVSFKHWSSSFKPNKTILIMFIKWDLNEI